jgi:hypothetical protein
MFYPTGKGTSGRCLVCMEDEASSIGEALLECGSGQLMEAFKKWLDENNFCVECWQMKENLVKRGISAHKLEEDMGDGGAPVAPAGAPAGNAFATLGNTNGMGMVAPPTNGGTNVGFYDSSKNGSGDKFPSLAVGTPAANKKKKKFKTLASYMEFIRPKKRK